MAAATGVVQGHQAADCHVHVFDPRYAYAPNPRYEPEPFVRGTAADFTAVLDAHGITHALLLAAEPYRDDNRPVLDAIAASGGRFKGIALVGDPLPDEAALRRLADAGIVGIRFNLAAGTAILQAPGVPRLLAQMREMGWFLDLHTIGDDLAQALPHLPAEGPRLLIDHVARPDVALGEDQPGFQALLALARTGAAVVKLCGGFRFSRTAFPHADTDAFVRRAIAAFGLSNCIWGSDWPFVNMPARMDYGPQLAMLARWLPDAADRRVVLWEAPARLFGFR